MATRVNARRARPAAPANPRSKVAVGPDVPLGSLLGEAQAAVSTSANALRDIRERYRSAHQADVIELEVLSAEVARNGNGRSGHKRDEAIASASLGEERSGLDRLDLALRSLEDAWVLLEPSDQTLRAGSPAAGASDTDLQMRILEAQEAERGRLAREVHDGPAQALSNAIFQVEVVERLLDRDERLARQELASLREILTRELRGVRAYLSQLRPPLLADLGLGGAIREAAGQIGSVLGVSVSVEVETEADDLPDSTQVVILRIVQEALQNVRKHAKPSEVRVRAVRDGTSWTVEVRDDGVGFDSDRAPDTGRRSFGLAFMRERADLIGARFEVRSRPDLGTVVRLVIPWHEEERS